MERNHVGLRSEHHPVALVSERPQQRGNPSLEVFRANHNGGVLRFGPDGKLYIIIGDNGRHGWDQNNLEGPVPDDDFGDLNLRMPI
jgi:hypothetical protein